ncbi:efflux transporter, RND family, MFP subunit [Anaeromyxobacter sp. K]|uniref:efflux RND transporter periplasmic adaptor subunit n=1 Tax=Anaeromyxobacter sp. (strain K) TaxID=447217 RepID=UPI00017BE417|nr:efflux RND transporter periplasmic adaptor subunit [Anaeromyxobacter sp. K]ACG74475.1 efflux transporter, RND family, MFP subunit [Anaeromyxobacter sp. K]
MSAKRRALLAGFAARRGRVLALAAAGVAAACGAALAARPPALATARVRRVALRETVVASGRVLAAGRAELGLPLAGVVRAVHVDRGARVRAGEVLLELDDAALAATLEERRAALGAAEARLAQLATTSAASASAGLSEADAALRRAEAELRRAATLRAEEAIAPAALEEAELAADRARSRRATALAAREDVQGAELRLARARAAEAAAAVRTAEARLREARVRAPADGLVLERRAEPGDVVTAGRALLVLATDGEARVAVELDERHLARVRPGQLARVAADAWPEVVFGAVVASVGPGVDPARGTSEVRLRVPDPPRALVPDQTVSVEVETGARPDALAIPPEGLREAPDGSTWCAVVRDGRLARAAVRAGLRAAHAVEVTNGLAEGEAVATGAAAEALLGRRVRPREER